MMVAEKIRPEDLSKKQVEEACDKVRSLMDNGDAGHCVLGMLPCILARSKHCPRRSLRRERGREEG